MTLALPNDQMVYRLGWTLIHTLWIGAAVAAMFAVAIAALRRRSAAARYLAGCIAMAVLMAGAVVTFALSSPPAAQPVAVVAVAPAQGANSKLPPVDTGTAYHSGPTVPRVRPLHVPDGQSPASAHGADRAPAVVSTKHQAPQREEPLLASAASTLNPALPWFVLAWAIGVGVLALWQLTGWIAAQRLTRLSVRPADAGLVAQIEQLARKLGVRRAVKVLESALARVPTVIGWLRPVILLPLGFATGLTPDQVESILVHELSHIRRYDYLVNLLQSLVETLLFYHPATWYISRRIRLERENCCDDLALAFGASQHSYAESLLHIARNAKTRSRPKLAPVGMAAAGKNSELRSRVGRVLGAKEDTSRLARCWPVVIVFGAIILASSSLLMTLNAQSTDSSSPKTMPATQPGAAQPHSRPSGTDLAKMSKQDRLKYVVEQIRRRDAAMTNFEYTLTEDSASYEVSTKRITNRELDSTLTVKRKGNTYWLHSVEHGKTPMDTVDTIVGWDGRERRGYSHYWLQPSGKKQLGGSIDNTEPETLIWSRYSHILGFRVLDGGGDFMTLAEWVQERLDEPSANLRAELHEVDGRQLVALRSEKIDPPNYTGYTTRWFDPAKGFMTVKHEWHTAQKEVEHVVNDARQVGGVWVPTKVVCIVGSVGEKSRPYQSYDISSFQLNTVRDKDLKVVFPVGCEVVDIVRKVGWILKPEGPQMIRIFDPNTKQLSYPSNKQWDIILKTRGQSATDRPNTQPSTQVIDDKGAPEEVALAKAPTLNLETTARMLTQKVGGKWQLDEHNSFPRGTRIIRGAKHVGDSDVLNLFDVFPFPSGDKRRKTALKAYWNARAVVIAMDQRLIVIRHTASEKSDADAATLNASDAAVAGALGTEAIKLTPAEAVRADTKLAVPASKPASAPARQPATAAGKNGEIPQSTPSTTLGASAGLNTTVTLHEGGKLLVGGKEVDRPADGKIHVRAADGTITLKPSQPTVVRQRDALLAQADKQIRAGLVKLAEDYPQLKAEAEYWNNVSRPSEPGQVSIWLYHTDKGKAATTEQIPAQERVVVAVHLTKPPTAPAQQGGMIYPGLSLFGQLTTTAGEPKLDAALKQLVAHAVAPLAKLEQQVSPPDGRSNGSKLEFRIAPKASDLDKEELAGLVAELKAGKIGFWYRTARITGRMPDHAWLPISGELTNASELVTGEYKGQKYVLVSDKAGQAMLPGEGAWGLTKVNATKDHLNQPAIGFALDERGAERFAALTKANLNSAMAIVVDGKVVSAPVIKAPLGKTGMITGTFTEQEVAALVQALKIGMLAATHPAAQPDTRLAGQANDDVVVGAESTIQGRVRGTMADGTPFTEVVNQRLSSKGTLSLCGATGPIAIQAVGRTIHDLKVAVVAAQRAQGLRDVKVDLSVVPAGQPAAEATDDYPRAMARLSRRVPNGQPTLLNKLLGDLHSQGRRLPNERELAAIQSLIADSKDIDARDTQGRSALHWAAWDARPAIVKLLLDKGATVNAMADKGWTPLHYAVDATNDVQKVRKRVPEVVALLLKAGADPFVDIRPGELAGMRPIEMVNPKGRSLAGIVRELQGGTTTPAEVVEVLRLLWTAMEPGRKAALAQARPVAQAFLRSVAANGADGVAKAAWAQDIERNGQQKRDWKQVSDNIRNRYAGKIERLTTIQEEQIDRGMAAFKIAAPEGDDQWLLVVVGRFSDGVWRVVMAQEKPKDMTLFQPLEHLVGSHGKRLLLENPASTRPAGER